MPDADLVNFIKKLPLIVKNDRPKKAARGGFDVCSEAPIYIGRFKGQTVILVV